MFLSKKITGYTIGVLNKGRHVTLKYFCKLVKINNEHRVFMVSVRCAKNRPKTLMSNTSSFLEKIGERKQKGTKMLKKFKINFRQILGIFRNIFRGWRSGGGGD